MALTQWLPRQQRQGTYRTGSFLIDPATTRLRIVGDMTQAVLTDPNAIVRVRIYKSNDGIEWPPVADQAIEWHGGTGFIDKDGTVNPPPRIVIDADSLAYYLGKWVMGEIDVPVQISVGVLGEIV